MKKILLRRNVSNLGRIGEVVEVKDGYARNYLVPQGLAVAPTEANLKAIEAEKAAYLEELASQRAELETQAKLLSGKEFTIAALANEQGELYGSVGPAQIAAAAAEEGILLEPRNIVLDEPIHRLDKYQVSVRFGEDVTASISVWIVPPRDSDIGEGEGPAEAAAPEAAEAGDQPGPEAAEDEAPKES